MTSPSYRALVRANPAFRRLWLGDVASFLGDWFNLIAIYTSVQALTSSKLAVGAVVAAKTLPNFLMIPVAGPIVDRFDRRRLLLAADFARAGCAAGLIAAHAAGSLAALYGLTFAMVVFTAIAFPAKKAALPMVVPRDHIGAANALMGATWSVMLAIGAALGGAAVATVGVAASFAIDGATYLMSAALFAGLPRLRPPAAALGGSARFSDAVRYLRRAPDVLATACVKPFGSVANGAVVALIPLYGTVAFERRGALWMGLLYAARGAGAAVGSLGLRAWSRDRPPALRRLIAVGFALIAAGMAIAGTAGSMAVAAAGFFVAAVGSGGNWVLSGTLLQLEADPTFHGRVFSIEFGVGTLVLALSGIAVGAVQDALGVTVFEAALWWGALAVPGLVFWLAVLAAMRRGDARRPAASPPLHPAPPA
ncbi:MAG: MFS transporter [Deltaproteobacteria bacterium]|nr:MAG: MFS transporter [Deltaproteobacteria bacterium]